MIDQLTVTDMDLFYASVLDRLKDTLYLNLRRAVRRSKVQLIFNRARLVR
jgi:hypothetical protein